MNNTAILVLIAIVAVAGIFWLVIYSGRRGREHREKTTIKAPESHRHARLRDIVLLGQKASELPCSFRPGGK